MTQLSDDTIQIRNLEVFARHGVLPAEFDLGQKFLVDVTFYTDTRRAGMQDDLAQSIDYGSACHAIQNFLTEHTYHLIEAAAEQLARQLLETTPSLQKVSITLKKPWAPIGLPLETVSVAITRGWHTAYIALGSNMGDRAHYLDVAVDALSALPGCELLSVSDYIETKPYGMVEQDDFLNACLALRTYLSPEELLDRLHEIERTAKRVRTVRWGPRTLDLDLLLYDDLVQNSKQLTIPHAEMHLREFVLVPLAQIAPWVRHPIFGLTATQMLRECQGANTDDSFL